MGEGKNYPPLVAAIRAAVIERMDGLTWREIQAWHLKKLEEAIIEIGRAPHEEHRQIWITYAACFAKAAGLAADRADLENEPKYGEGVDG